MSAPHPADGESAASAKAADPTPTPSLLSSSRAPKHDIHMVMNFDQLLRKVEQAEDALESRERQVVADWHRLQGTWRAAWTPGRVLIAGLASGFAFGRASRGSKGGGSGFLRILSTVSGLIASANAQIAAHEAEHVAQRVDAGACGGDGYDDGPYDDGPDDGPIDDRARAGLRGSADHARAAFERDAHAASTLAPDEAVRRAGAESARP
jgi:hypothetical protein